MEATKSFESTMENQLELTELRKAQRELNEAFSFRRSINTDEMAPAFSTSESVVSNVGDGDGAATMSASTTATMGTILSTEEDEGINKKKRRLVRRKKRKKVEVLEAPKLEDKEMMVEYPDLDMLDSDFSEDRTTSSTVSEEERRRAERLKRLSSGSSPTASSAPSQPDWFTVSDDEVATQLLKQPSTSSVNNPALARYEKERFQAQLSAEQWNSQVMANEDKLSPLSMVMKRLAILEEEKQAADRRLEEEYQRRMENEDKYYLEKRKLLEEAIGEIQEGIYTSMTKGGVDGQEDKTGKLESTSTNNGTKFTA